MFSARSCLAGLALLTLATPSLSAPAIRIDELTELDPATGELRHLTTPAGLSPHGGRVPTAWPDLPLGRLRPHALDDGYTAGGSSVRSGSYLGQRVTCMPPMYINVGAYVDDETLVDSHALVGSCAQIGKRVHLSAAVQIGGVLEPIGQAPVIIEDDVMVGGNSGVYEGQIV